MSLIYFRLDYYVNLIAIVTCDLTTFGASLSGTQNG